MEVMVTSLKRTQEAGSFPAGGSWRSWHATRSRRWGAAQGPGRQAEHLGVPGHLVAEALVERHVGRLVRLEPASLSRLVEPATVLAHQDRSESPALQVRV